MTIDVLNAIGRGLAGLVLAGLVAGCSAGGPASPPRFGEGLAAAKLDPVIDAWIAGDATALSTAIQTVKTDSLAARSTPDWDTACTEEAMSARAANLTAILAEGLNEPTVLAMPDLARMDFLDVLGQGKAWGRHDIQMPFEPDCAAVDRTAQKHVAAEWRLLLAEMPRRRAVWYAELKAKYGAEYGARLLLAADLLRRNGVPSTVYGDD
jgi:hypothetical protein